MKRKSRIFTALASAPVAAFVSAAAVPSRVHAGDTATSVAFIPNTSLPIPSTSLTSTTVPFPTTSTTMPEPECGDANGDGGITASDSLVILKVAVSGELGCSMSRCDTDGNGDISATDALRVLRVAVGGSIVLVCTVG